MVAGKPLDDAEFLRLFNQGLRPERIAAVMNVNVKTLYLARIRLKLPPFPPFDRKKLKPSGHAVPSVDRELVRMLDAEGYSAPMIAKAVGCSAKSVTRIRRELGISKAPDQHPGYGPEVKAKALEMLEDGASYKEVSKTLGVSEKTVWRWFPGMGWTRSQTAEYRYMLKALEKLDTAADRRVYSNL